MPNRSQPRTAPRYSFRDALAYKPRRLGVVAPAGYIDAGYSRKTSGAHVAIEREGAWREQGETCPTSSGESGGSEKDEAPVELRAIAPKHAEGECDGEAGDIKEWNADVGISETVMLHVKMGTPHSEGGGDA